jgi:hypothetical protein
MISDNRQARLMHCDEMRWRVTPLTMAVLG